MIGANQGIRKRTPNACQRCRTQKIKCSGSNPCSNCYRSGKTCIFDPSDSTVTVSKRHLSNLEERLAALEGDTRPGSQREETGNDVAAAPSGHSSGAVKRRRLSSDLPATGSVHPEAPQDAQHGQSKEPSLGRSRLLDKEEVAQMDSQENELEMVNPLSAGPPDAGFIHHSASDSLVYLGTSSNWSFSRRVLDSAHRAVRGTPLKPENFALDGDICNLDDHELTDREISEQLSLPSLSHARYLVQSVQFHVGDLYHLFDEETFFPKLTQLYQSPTTESAKTGLWYIHYLLLLALGKSCVSQRLHRGRPPGAEFFARAMHLLPPVHQLWTDAFTVAEIHCCAALYLQGVDYRYGAYASVGSAMRTALFQGMHTDLPAGLFGKSQLERARRIWWTVYVLDRELSSLMGLPVQLSDELITAKTPTISSREQDNIFALHIKLCRLNAQVVSTVYGPDGRLDKRFLTSTRASLREIAEIAEQLSKSFKLGLGSTAGDIPRLAATLHLQHHQCVVLTIRPLIFSLYKKRLEPPHTSPSMIASMEHLRILLQMGADSAQHLLSILFALQQQDSLESFIPFDLENAFSSAVIVLIAAVVEPALIDDIDGQRTKAFSVLEDLIAKGNLIAGRRKAELRLLDTLLQTFSANERESQVRDRSQESAELNQRQDLPSDALHGKSTVQAPVPANPNNGLFEDWSWQDALDADQLLSVADLLDLERLEAFSADFSFS